MSVAAAVVRRGCLFAPLPGDRGVSEGARKIEEKLNSIQTDAVGSVAFGNRQRVALVTLWEAFEEASKGDWDGHGAEAADPRSWYQTLRLLMSIPVTLPLPDISVTPQGQFLLEWHKQPMKTFTLSVSNDGALVYAGILGSKRTHGTEYFADE